MCSAGPPTLRGTEAALSSRYDVALLDLDGVVYLGGQAIEGAVSGLREARAAGMRLAFVTNNAARPPDAVAANLNELGIEADAHDVTTSAQAAAHYLADRLSPGAKVLMVGTLGLRVALAERGLVPVDRDDADVVAVVQGFSAEMSWKQLAEGAVAIRRGACWVATNLDPTVPSARGPLPGNGSLVAALRHATGAQPIATGKPDPTMHRESVQRSGAQRPLVVGDRLDTDIEGANAAGCPSLLVLSGVTTAAELIVAGPGLRPWYLARDVRGLLQRHPQPRIIDHSTAQCGEWQAQRGTGVLRLRGALEGASDAVTATDGTAHDGLDPLRALCVAAWDLATEGAATQPSGSTRAVVPIHAEDDAAQGALASLGLLSAG